MADPGIRLVVGLGNPGSEYERTRHNVGFWFVDSIAAAQGAVFRSEGRLLGMLCRVNVGVADLRLFKPLTYMNRSGQAVSSILRYFQIPVGAMLVVHDELDLLPGSVRLKQGGGHAGHNGLRDVISALGSPEFWRLRVGIGHPGDRSRVVDYVLSRASRADEDAILDALELAAGCLKELVEGEQQKAMNRLHSSR